MFKTEIVDREAEFAAVQQEVAKLSGQRAIIKTNLSDNQKIFIKGKYYHLNK